MKADVGQFLFVGFPGTELTDSTRRMLETVRPGGVVLFTRNLELAEQARALTRVLKQELPRAPIVAIDQEHGRVNRLRNIVGELPTIAELKRDNAVEEFARKMGTDLSGLGINLNFAPVLDLELFDAQTDNALRDRCWGRTAAEAQPWATAFVRGLQGAGVAACVKHFPGLGGARLDSHDHLPTITRSREELLGEDVQAFVEMLPHVGAVMVGHGHYPVFDGDRPLPASLSRRIVTGLLREKLGFGGLVVTDDLEMGAISRIGGFGEAVVEAFGAGADVLLVCHREEKILAAHEALTRAVEAGRITTMRLAESQRRMELFQQRWIGPKS